MKENEEDKRSDVARQSLERQAEKKKMMTDDKLCTELSQPSTSARRSLIRLNLFNIEDGVTKTRSTGR